MSTSALILRSVRADGTITDSLSTSAVRKIGRRYGSLIGIPDLNPHDLRRTYAKLARTGGCPIETVQKSLGHSSVRTTELYLQTGEECNAGDYIAL